MVVNAHRVDRGERKERIEGQGNRTNAFIRNSFVEHYVHETEPTAGTGGLERSTSASREGQKGTQEHEAYRTYRMTYRNVKENKGIGT